MQADADDRIVPQLVGAGGRPAQEAACPGWFVRQVCDDGRTTLAELLLNSVRDAIVGLDREGVVTYLNPAAARLLEVTVDASIQRPFHEIVYHTDAAGAPCVSEHCAIIAACRAGQAFEVRDDLFYRTEGTRMLVEGTGQPIFHHGSSIGAVVTFREISALRQMEALRLRQAHITLVQAAVSAATSQCDTLREMLQLCAETIGCHTDGAGSMIWLLQPDGLTLTLHGATGISTEVAEMLGQVAVGSSLIGTITTERWPYLTQNLASEARRADTTVLATAGIATLAGYPLVVDDRAIGVVVLISAQVLPAEILNVLAAAAVAVAQGISHRESIMALRAMEAADRANRAKSEFLSRMSHELRTPLNAVLGFAQVLETSTLSADQRQSVQHILNGGRHLLSLINEVLDIARIEANRLELAVESIPVTAMIEECLELIAPLSLQYDVLLQVESPERDDWHVAADRQRLKQVLLNLLANGVKYNYPGGIVTLSLHALPTGRVRIEVRDTGPGIPDEKLPRLFVPFDRLGAEGRGIEGTGLGLALSRNLVEIMHGTLGVQSVVGAGSTFWVEFPQDCR